MSHIAGTIEAEEKARLKKLLFRATRGKALIYYQDYQVAESGNKNKAVYVVMFQEGRQIREKILRICDSFMGQRFDLPEMSEFPQKLV